MDQVRRPHRRVTGYKPARSRRRPGVIAATRAELTLSISQRSGRLWSIVSRYAVVAGYPAARAQQRIRALRSDGAAALAAVAACLLTSADVRSGFVGRPRKGGGHWERYKLTDIAQFALGAQDDTALRQTRRALDVMTGLGWCWPTRQVRRHIGDGEFRSEPGVRRLNLDRLCKLAGTTWLLSRDRQHADRTKGERAGVPLAAGPAGHGEVDLPSGARPRPPSTAAPPATVARYIDDILTTISGRS